MLKLKSIDFDQQQFQIHQLDQSAPGQLEWLIGRNPACDLVLASPVVSRVHGRIFCADNTYHFVDVGSTSGSILNGELVPANEKRPLQVGDLLQIGETFLHVEALVPPSLSAIDPIPALSEVESPWDDDLLCRCCRIIDETPDVKTFCFVGEPTRLFSYKPGQFVNLEVEIDGKPVMRCYSISSSPTRPHHLSLTVKRVAASSESPPGLVSNWLHDRLSVGDRIKISSPLGQFTCLPNLPPKLLLISAGSGITPMMSMSRWVQDTLVDCDVVFLHSARNPEDLVFRTELATMAAQMSNFRLAVTITQQSFGHAWMGLTGRISEAMLHSIAPDFRDRAVFVCGPDGFMQGIRSMLEAMNFPMQQYQQESFGGSKPKAGERSTEVSGMPSAVSSTVPIAIPTTVPTAMPTAMPTVMPTVTVPTSPVMPSVMPPIKTNSNGHQAELSVAPTVQSNIAPTVPTIAPATTAAPVVNFTESRRDILADGSSSILELAEQEGIHIRNSCRVGACGACKVRTHQGQVRYDTSPQALTPKDQQAGYVLACVAYPTSYLMVEA